MVMMSHGVLNGNTIAEESTQAKPVPVVRIRSNTMQANIFLIILSSFEGKDWMPRAW